MRALAGPDDAVRPTSLDWRLALQLQAKFDKERSRSLKVVDNDADVVHPQNRHLPEHGRSTMAAQRRGSVKVLVQPPKDSLEAIAAEFFSAAFRPWVFLSPPAEPDVHVPAHPALHATPMGHGLGVR